MQDDHKEYQKPSKKPRKDFTRESRDRKRLGDLATTIMLATTTSAIPLTIITGAL